MAKVLTDVRLFAGIADLTAQTNKVELEWSAEAKETTNYGSGGKKTYLAGVEDTMIGAEGQWEAGDPGYADDQWWAQRRALETFTIGEDGATVGDPAFLTNGIRLESKLFGGGVGEVANFVLSAKGNQGLALGMFAHGPGAPVTTDADGTAIQLGAVPAGQRLYATLHVLSVAGTMTPELDVIIESDTTEDFDDTPETRLVFDTVTAAGSQLVRSSIGAHADTWYRASFAVEDNGGTGASFLVVVAIGIG